MRATARARAAAYRRTTLIGLSSLGLVVWSLHPATADTTAPFANGTAKATAVVARVAPGVGALELGLGNAIAVAELRNKLAQAQAQSLDLGLIGTTLTAEGCDGSEASITPDDLPQATRVDNRKGETSATSDEIPMAGATFGAGREVARATTAPLAGAVATSVASFGPVASVSGGRAEAVTEVIDGAARQARATVDADVVIAGVLELSGLRWDARHRSGGDPSAAAAFDIGTAHLFGVPLPVDSLGALQVIINQALAPTGVSVLLPTVERFTEPNDVVRVTPLRVVLKDSPAGKTALSPVLDLTRQQRGDLFDDLAAAYCRSAGALLVGDIATSIAAGTGFLAIEIGGAEATSGELVLENPFGDPVAPPGGPLPSPAAPEPAGPGIIPPALPPAPVPAGNGPRPTPVVSVGPLEAVCESIHPLRAPGCSRGAMAPLGLLGLVATAGVAALDWRHQRRRAAGVTGAGVTGAAVTV